MFAPRRARRSRCRNCQRHRLQEQLPPRSCHDRRAEERRQSARSRSWTGTTPAAAGVRTSASHRHGDQARPALHAVPSDRADRADVTRPTFFPNGRGPHTSTSADHARRPRRCDGLSDPGGARWQLRLLGRLRRRGTTRRRSRDCVSLARRRAVVRLNKTNNSRQRSGCFCRRRAQTQCVLHHERSPPPLLEPAYLSAPARCIPACAAPLIWRCARRTASAKTI